MNSCIIFAISNQKGGVGKTTTAINLATAIAAFGKRVLLVDLDPQGNTTTGLGIDLNRDDATVYDLLVNDSEVSNIARSTKIKKLDLLPSNINLAAAETELNTLENKEFVLKKKLRQVSENYDFIFIDCPPTLNLLTVNALTSASKLVIPLQCEFFALEGVAHLRKTVSLIQDHLNPGLEIEGIVLTMMDRRNKLCLQVAEDVRSIFKEKVFATVIPRNIKLSEAPSHGMPALIYDPRCSGSYAYIMLAKEVLAKLGQFNDNTSNEYDNRKKSIG